MNCFGISLIMIYGCELHILDEPGAVSLAGCNSIGPPGQRQRPKSFTSEKDPKSSLPGRVSDSPLSLRTW